METDTGRKRRKMQRLNNTAMEIPLSVVMDILSTLPVKSLVRFRCVCKLWSSSLQSPLFTSLHYRITHERSKPNLLVNDDRPYISAVSVQGEDHFSVSEYIRFPFSSFGVYGPCNGLLLFSGEKEQLAIWNPSTREFKIIPKSTVEREYCCYGHLGFGFDSRTDDYKVIRFVFDYVGTFPDGYWDNQVELYSLKTDSWKEVPFPASMALPCHSTCFVNGIHYWLANGDSGKCILSFDMHKEEFSVLLLSNLANYEESRLKLLDFNGSLGVIAFPRQRRDDVFFVAGDGAIVLPLIERRADLWVLNMDGSWTRQVRIAHIPEVKRSLGLWNNDKMFVEGLSHELILLDLVAREVKNLGMHGIPGIRHPIQLISYVESMVPINGRSEHEEGIIRIQTTV